MLPLLLWLIAVPRPTVVDVQSAVNDALRGCQPCTYDLNHDGRMDVLDVQILVARILAPCQRAPITVVTSTDGSFFTWSSPIQPQVIFWAAQPVSGTVEIRMWGRNTPNFNTSFPQDARSVFGLGWAMTQGGKYTSEAPDVLMRVIAGRFQPPAWGCLN